MATAPKSLQVSCVQMHWARTLEENLEKTVGYINEASKLGSRVVLFPEANLTGYYFPYLVKLSLKRVKAALAETCHAVKKAGLWAIAGTVQKTSNKFLNLAHLINPKGEIAYEYAKVNMAGSDEKKYCRGGDKLALFDIDGIPCTVVICRDGRHPELYRIPAMAGAVILFHPSCSTNSVEAVTYKRVSGRAQQPVGPNSMIYHCVANTVGQSPDGKETTSGYSFIREPSGLPLAEAGYYREEIITAVLDLKRATRKYVKDSMANPPFLRKYWKEMVADMKARADNQPK